MSWIERVSANILPLSESKDVTHALKEWVYTGDCYDLEAPIEDCRLCDHPNIRYQFVILNQGTGHTLLIGSECITRFGISALDAWGNILSDEQTQQQVTQDRNRLITDARRRRMVNALVQLAAVDEEVDLDSFVDYFEDRNAFTPKQLAFLFWRLDSAEIAHQKADFKMVIRRNREKDQLRAMPKWQVKKIWAALSPSQRRWYAENV